MKETWHQTMAFMQTELSPHAYSTWLKPLHYKTTEGDTVLVEVPNSFYKNQLQHRYAKLLQDKLRMLSCNDSVQISFLVSTDLENSTMAWPRTPTISTPSLVPKKEPSGECVLNQRYTFDRFVVGNNNQFAHAGALAVAENPGQKYNPLFIYGGVGLGKTHLLCAIGNHRVAKNSGLRVIYKTSEQFMIELINSIRYEKTEAFRTRYRNTCDMLLLDDIHFFSGKERTQEEFFHTFNSLHQANKQIVLTSDRKPMDIADLDDRLRSRFQSGLFCDIQTPDIETRVAILKKKAEQESVLLPDDIALLLAKHFKSNIRLLEGAFTRLAAFSSLSNKQITMDLVLEVFGDLQTETIPISIETIQKKVADFFNLNLADIKSTRRHKVVALPRQIAMYLARKKTNASFPELGQRFGGKDHTTIMHAVQKIEKNLEKDPRLRNTVFTIEQTLVGLH